MQWDLGDAVAEFNFWVKGRSRYRARIQVGVPEDTTSEDRVVRGPPYYHGVPASNNRHERTFLTMDLQADKKVPLSFRWTDELGNVVPEPADASVAWSVDDPTVINLTDNEDGTAVAAATGTIALATVHAEGTGDGSTLHADFALNVVVGLAERGEIVAGEPEEVTPD